MPDQPHLELEVGDQEMNPFSLGHLYCHIQRAVFIHIHQAIAGVIRLPACDAASRSSMHFLTTSRGSLPTPRCFTTAFASRMHCCSRSKYCGSVRNPSVTTRIRFRSRLWGRRRTTPLLRPRATATPRASPVPPARWGPAAGLHRIDLTSSAAPRCVPSAAESPPN